MSKHIDKLTEEQVMRAFAEDKPRKMFDGAGLYVILFPSGLKSWRMKYRDERGKEMTLTFGRYPEVSLVLARYRCSIARQMLNEGQDPRRKFDRAHTRAATWVWSRRLLPAFIDKKKLSIRAEKIGLESVGEICALVFPAIQRLSAGSEQSETLALFEKVRRERGAEVVELLYDICAEVIRNCLDAGIDENILTTAMTDTRVMRRRFS